MHVKTKKADECSNTHQPDFAASGKETASQRVAPAETPVKHNWCSVLNTWRADARSRAMQNEYATWVALAAEVSR